MITVMGAVHIHLLIVCIVTSCVADTLPKREIVNIPTPLGRITGDRVSVGGSNATVIRFRGIPYAKAPVGNLRFAKPVPYGGWNNSLQALEYGAACLQINDSFGHSNLRNKSENCLFLNIFVPNNISITQKKSVMVWIHGGAYIFGAGSLYNGSYLAVKGDVVVVTINYRLGLFGFFSLGPRSDAPGNYGLWDQILALKWVNSYIAAFGGDPNSVTIFGESAGGFSVSLLSIIPSNKGLFHRVIAESGVSNSHFATSDLVKLSTDAIGAELLCETAYTDPTEFLSCMRSKNGSSIIQALMTTAEYLGNGLGHFTIPLSPVVDNELFSDTPFKIISGPPSAALAFFRSLDMIVGNCNMEGSLALTISNVTQKRYHFNFTEGMPYRVFDNHILTIMDRDYFDFSPKVKGAVCQEYCVPRNLPEQARQFLQMYTDFFFIAPSVANLNFHSTNNSQSSTYQYVFSRRSPAPYGPKRPPWYQGSGHASELLYLFGVEAVPSKNITIPPQDQVLAEKMKVYWTNFAKYGNPNGESTVQSLTRWPTYDPYNRRYLGLDNVTSAESNYNGARVKFWLEDVPQLLRFNYLYN